jgi:hypothetical protein
MKFGISTMDSRDRVRIGVRREGQIADALRTQAGLELRDATDDEDKGRQKIDRWLIRDGQSYGMQIKFRETGADILFEVFDTFHGFGDARNKRGRDMIGQAEYYTVLAQDGTTAYVVPVSVAHRLISQAMEMIEEHGWTIVKKGGSVFKWFMNGCKIEIKLTTDPKDGRPKIIAFIPPDVFAAEQQVEVYKLKLKKLNAA